MAVGGEVADVRGLQRPQPGRPAPGRPATGRAARGTSPGTASGRRRARSCGGTPACESARLRPSPGGWACAPARGRRASVGIDCCVQFDSAGPPSAGRRQVDVRHAGAGERHQQRRGAVPLDLQAGAGAVVVHRAHPAERRAGGVDARPGRSGRRGSTRPPPAPAAARGRCTAGCWSASPPRCGRRPSPARRRPVRKSPPRPSPRQRRTKRRPARRSADRTRSGRRDRRCGWSPAPGRARRAAGRSRPTGCGSPALSAQAPAAAALARSCAFFFGADCTGCSRHTGIGPRPALPRKRATRSVASAPWLEPMLDALGLQADAVLVFGRQHRVVAAQLLDEAAVARAAAVGDHDVVVRALLGAGAGQADLQAHRYLVVSCQPRPGLQGYGRRSSACGCRGRHALRHQRAPRPCRIRPFCPSLFIRFIIVRHVVELLQQLVDLLHRRAGPGGDALLAAGLDDVGLLPLLASSSTR